MNLLVQFICQINNNIYRNFIATIIISLYCVVPYIYILKMYSHTKKVGSAGRYGVRAGRRLRKEILRIEDDAKRLNRCPECSKKVKREAVGIWMCRSCGLKFAGTAYFSGVSLR